MASIDLEALREAVRQDRYVMTAHAKQRMGLRQVTDADMKRVVTQGDVIEDYPDAKPYPKCLLMAEIGRTAVRGIRLRWPLCLCHYRPSLRS